jgi:hypothetical protein
MVDCKLLEAMDAFEGEGGLIVLTAPILASNSLERFRAR